MGPVSQDALDSMIDFVNRKYRSGSQIEPFDSHEHHVLSAVSEARPDLVGSSIEPSIQLPKMFCKKKNQVITLPAMEPASYRRIFYKR